MLPPALDKSICSLCNGTGWKSFQDGEVERVTRCECWRAKNVARMFKQSHIPVRYSHCDLDNFQTSSDSLVRALNAGKGFADSFPVVSKGLLFYGPPGVGKSHLSAAILRRVIQRVGARAIFCESKEFLRMARETNNPQSALSETDVLHPVLNAELLVFDDLGSERMTDWVHETLNLIVNVRYNEKRPTVFATNHPPLDADPKSMNPTLEEKVGSRIFSRLHEMCEFVEMITVDHRRLSPDASPEDFARLDKKGRRADEIGIPQKSKQARAYLKRTGDGDLKWSGGRAGNK